jgi:DNA-binding NtrC family response regulator
VRVVAATHRDLETDVKQGKFREDLYYRLKVVEVEIPPLRERLADVPALVARFLAQLAERLDRDPKPIAPDALSRLAQHGWPGNVRELRNVVEQAAVLAPGDAIEASDLRLPETESGPAPPAQELPFSEAKRQTVADFERGYLLAALRRNGGNVSRTAAAIGMVRQSLQQPKSGARTVRETAALQAEP